MTDLVPIRKGMATQISLTELQDLLDAREQVAEDRSVVSTKKSRVEEAKRSFDEDPKGTLLEIQYLANTLVSTFDVSLTGEAVPFSQAQINSLSREYFHLEKLRIEIEALETRYRALVYAHLDETGPKIPGRPVSQVPGKMKAQGPGPHYVFERRGGNRANPDLDVEGLREVLPAELAAQVYGTMHHDAVPAYDEPVFNEKAFSELVDQGKIDLDTVAPFLAPGAWRKPSFYKTLVDGEQ